MMEILPGVGLGSIHFGMKEVETDGILGPADDRDEYGDEDEDEAGDVDRYYWELGISLFFSGEDQGRLATIEIDSRCECQLFGLDPFLLPKADLVNLLSSRSIPAHGWKNGSPIEKDCICQTAVNFRHLSMTLYFDEDEKLEEIMWGVLVDENDEIGWPDPR